MATRPLRTMAATSKLAGLAGAALLLGALFVSTYYPGQRAALVGLAMAGAAALVFFLVAERRLLARAPSSRAARQGANAAVITLAFAGILVFLNLLAVRHNQKWDLTAGQLFTLSEQAVKVLGGLSAEVTATAFFADGGEERARMKRLLDDCAGESRHLRVVFVDPDKNPALARQHGIREYGTTVFESGGQTYRITETTEDAVVNALVRVSREAKKTVCVLAGHGEHSLQDTQRGGYSEARKALEAQGFAVQETLLLREAEVPPGCDVLAVAGPTKPFLPEEVAAVRAYLGRGGRVLALIDPQTQTGLEALLAEWGAVVRDDLIVDTMSRLFGGSYTTPVVTEYPSPEVTGDLRVATFLPLARSLAVAEPLPAGITHQPLARTAPQAWGETDLRNDKASFDPASDHRGPLTVAGLFERQAEGSTGGGQLLVVGDSDFADNAYFHFSGNGDFFQNLVSYLAKEEDLVAVRPKQSKPSPLILSQAQAATLFYGSVVVAPLALAVAGLGMWWRRKNL
ncbi:MAG: GldG family protein [Deferrisomatales bacterium]